MGKRSLGASRESATEIGVSSMKASAGKGGIELLRRCAKMLQEGSYQFDFHRFFLDLRVQADNFTVLITLNEKMKKELLQYQKQAGKILALIVRIGQRQVRTGLRCIREP